MLRRHESEVALTAREFGLLTELAGHRGEVLSRSLLMSKVGGADFDGAPNVVYVYVCYLRGKFETLGAAEVAIRVVRGIGFRLAVDSAQAGLGGKP